MEQQATATAARLDGEVAALQQLGGKYMTFQLAREVYGLEILAVREIIGLMEITRVPRTAEFIRGVINLRGRIIPVVDLVLEVLTIDGAQIEPPPDLGSASIEGQFIRGVGKTLHGVAFLLDTARILTGQDVQHLASATVQA